MSKKTPKIIADAKKAAKKLKPKSGTVSSAAVSNTSKKTAKIVAPAKKRKQRRDQPTSKENVKRLQRQNLVLELKTGGASIREISAYLTEKGYEASIGTVQSDLTNALGELHESKTLKTTQMVELEIRRIEKMWFVVWRKFMDDAEFIRFPFAWIAMGNFLTTLQNQRDKYLGLSKAIKLDIKMSPQDLLSKLTGRKPEDFPGGAKSDD